MADNDAATLAAQVERDLGHETERWFDPDGYESVALAVIDSIYSTGSRYSATLNAVGRYRDARRESGADACSDTASDLVAATDAWGGTDGLVEHTNRRPVSTKAGAPRKADAAYGAAKILAAHGLETRADVQRELTDPEKQKHSPVKKGWLALPGQSSAITWNYFLMLCGVPGVKADRMIVRYVSRALGHDVDPTTAAHLVGQVADEMGVHRTKLDHAIWRCESGREIYLDADVQP